MHTTKPKNILITFGRSFLALDLARQLHAAGHKIYLADSMRVYVGRFSNAVKRCFRIPSPRFNRNGFIDALVDITHNEKIDLIIPLYEEISYLSSAHHRFPETCQLFCPPFKLYNELHHKWLFHLKLEELGIPSPPALLIKHFSELSAIESKTSHAFKPCYSRASQKIIKINPNQLPPQFEIEPHNPWIAQEWLEGKRFCTYSICHEGKMYAHSTYPVNYAIDGNSCLIYSQIDHPSIVAWIQNFIEKTNYTGQIAFDFIETPNKGLFAIECNPRATSGLLLFNKKSRLDRAFLKQNSTIIYPEPKTKKQIATGMLLYGWRKSALPGNNIFKFIRTLCSTKDIVFSARDLKPFLFEPIVFGAILKRSRKHRLPISDAFTYDHDWNGEPIHHE